MNLNKFVQQLPKLRILVVGDVMIDEYYWGSMDRISPEAPVPVVALHKKEQRPGGAANVALNLLSLGIKTDVASVVGKDHNGKLLKHLLQQHSISNTIFIEDAQRQTTCKTRVLARNQQVLRIDDEVTHELPVALQKQFIKKVCDYIEHHKPHAIIFEDYDKGLLNEAIITAIIQKALSFKIITGVDPKKNNFAHYRQVTLFKPNARELNEALHIQIKPELNNLEEASLKLRQVLDCKNILITLSEHGVYYSGTQKGILHAHKRDIADVSGAGDTVIAVAVAALALNYNIEEAASVANLAGGLVCEHAGVVPITPQMLLQKN
jgi:rfaE bifunctional protein kinase chain/domain